jgi:hypothetical protein
VSSQKPNGKSQKAKPRTGAEVQRRQESGVKPARQERWKEGGAQGWTPLRKQERRLLRLLEQGPERRLFRVQGQTLLRVPAREPLRQQGR